MKIPSFKQFLLGCLFLFNAFAFGQTQVSISVSDNTAGETGPDNGQYLVTVQNGPGLANVQVNYAVAAGTTATSGSDFTPFSGSVTVFTNVSGNGSNTITLNVLDDDIDEDLEVVVLEITTGSYDIVAGQGSASINITDNDTAGVSVNPTSGNTTEGGGTFQFTITLDTEPLDAVTIPVSSNDTSEGVVDVSSAVLDNTNWDTGVTVTVTGQDDAVADGNVAYVIQTGDATSPGDPKYDAIGPAGTPDVNLTNTDNDTVGVTVTPTSGTTTESGGNFQFTVTLNTQPTAAVTIPISSNDPSEGTVSASQVVLDNTNWNTGQTITVTGVNDNIVDGNVSYTIVTGNPTSGDPAYNGLGANDVANVSATNTDNDTELTIANSSTTEGTGFVFTVTSSNAVPGGFTVNIGFTDGTATGGNLPLAFPEDYDNGVKTLNFSGGAGEQQQFGVATTNDTRVEGNETFTVTMTSGNPNVITSDTATGTIIDNDSCPTTAPTRNNSVPDEFCDSFSQDLNAYVSNTPPPNTVLRWSRSSSPAANGSNHLGSSVVNTADSYYGFFYDQDDQCLGPTLRVDITLNTSPEAGTTQSASACGVGPGDSTVDLDDQITGEDSGDWAVTSQPSGGNVTIPGNNNVDFAGQPLGNYVFTYTTDNAQAPCTEDSVTLTITVIDCTPPCDAGNTAPVRDADVADVFCDVITTGLDDYTNSNPPSGTTLTWSANPDPLIVANHLTQAQVDNPSPGTYYGFFYDATNSCASPTLEVTLTVNTTPVITGTTGDELCGPGQATLTVTGDIPDSPENPSYRWYATASSTQVLGNFATFTPNVTTTTTYFVEATANGCTSEREGVTVTVVPPVSAGSTNDTAACNVPENGPTLRDLDNFISGNDAGVWSISQDPSGVLTIESGNTVNFNNRPAGTYIFTYTTTGAQQPCTNESVDLTITVNSCDVDSDGDGLLDGQEAILGTNPNNVDTDADNINDNIEVGPNLDSPLDEDGDGIIDALESILTDTDNDGVTDQLDPANTDPCIPNANNEVCQSQPLDLQVQKEVDNPGASFGEQVVFTITLNNTDTRAASDIVVGDLLESGFEFVSAETSDGTYDPETGSWEIDQLNGMATATLTVTATLRSEGVFTNTAELLSSSPVDDNATNNSSTVTVNPDPVEGVDLVIRKEVVPSRPLVGEEILFRISVVNESSNETVVNNIRVEDIITEEGGFVFQNIIFNTHGGYDPLTGIWDIPSLAAGKEASLAFTALVPRTGNFINVATILSSNPVDGITENNTATVRVVVSERSSDEPGFIFNQFSPNGDGTNDILRINNIDQFPGNSLVIFDRYGNKIFEARDMTDSAIWDGRRNNIDVAEGTYFYILDLGDGSEVRKGWIQLIR
ncbi:T9SS type B sorting domain-containing protein [Zeaxanthinibacter enoshimensis]|uniref:Gliding motility-associated-like protein n=1 Tax=Zeaxanthinibacter enoshimensis TaxID=392009 RepID=A0A4R6TTI0_9FLAO|nr:gliding motility-associated C-terminal domain-containing protein [Zeaxanthinibacter enoshimensis]TDQ32248.1 gliding motility-associated-like protein [Zeaxanthinibacter enoshimensis]